MEAFFRVLIWFPHVSTARWDLHPFCSSLFAVRSLGIPGESAGRQEGEIEGFAVVSMPQARLTQAVRQLLCGPFCIRETSCLSMNHIVLWWFTVNSWLVKMEFTWLKFLVLDLILYCQKAPSGCEVCSFDCANQLAFDEALNTGHLKPSEKNCLHLCSLFDQKVQPIYFGELFRGSVR